MWLFQQLRKIVYCVSNLVLLFISLKSFICKIFRIASFSLIDPPETVSLVKLFRKKSKKVGLMCFSFFISSFWDWLFKYIFCKPNKKKKTLSGFRKCQMNRLGKMLSGTEKSFYKETIHVIDAIRLIFHACWRLW